MEAIRFVREFWTKVQEDQVTGLAAQLAYYFLLSLFPFLIFAITLFGYTDISVADVLHLLQRVMPQDALGFVQKTLQEVLEQRKGGLLSFGILGTIWAASTALNAMITALNHAYDLNETRSFFKARSLAIVLTFLMVFTILVSLLLPVLGDTIRRLVSLFVTIPMTFAIVWSAMRWVLSSCVMVGTLICIYYFAPCTRPRLTTVTIGALFAAACWQVTSLAFSYYLTSFAHYSATYGSLGTMIVLMIWLYLTALAIILGGELNALLHDRSRRPK